MKAWLIIALVFSLALLANAGIPREAGAALFSRD